jgi:hypothetical protein
MERDAWVQISLDPPISNNVRSAPGLQAALIGQLSPGLAVLLVDGPPGYSWWFVRGLKGWTAGIDNRFFGSILFVERPEFASRLLPNLISSS